MLTSEGVKGCIVSLCYGVLGTCQPDSTGEVSFLKLGCHFGGQ